MKLLNETLDQISFAPAPALEKAVRERWDSLTKPPGSLGRLEECVLQVALIQNSVAPQVERQAIYIFCGDHGITEEGVSAYPSVVTREMVENFVRGGAAINVLCRSSSIATRIIDAGIAGDKIEGVLDRRIGGGTKNFLHGPAMSRDQAIAALESGITLAQDASTQFDLIGVGEMGIGNSTAASALLCALGKISPADATGPGAGLDDAGVRHKREVISKALAHHQPQSMDAIAVAATFGGFEIVMMAGFILGAAAARAPVVVDGFISSAALLIARALCPEVARFVVFSHRSAEPGHSLLLDSLGQMPLLDLHMRLGEGTGAALAMGLITSSVKLFREMSTFAEAAVSGRSKLEQQF